jgi:hypothetical protein
MGCQAGERGIQDKPEPELGEMIRARMSPATLLGPLKPSRLGEMIGLTTCT